MAKRNRLGKATAGALGQAIALSAAVHLFVLLALSADNRDPLVKPVLGDETEFDIVLLDPALPTKLEQAPSVRPSPIDESLPIDPASIPRNQSQNRAVVAPVAETADPNLRPVPTDAASLLSMRTTESNDPPDHEISRKAPPGSRPNKPLPRWLRGDAPSDRIRDALARVELEEAPERDPLAPLVGPRKPRSLLRPTAGNQHRTDDTTVVATTRSDGTVRIEDRPNFSIKFDTDGAKSLLKSALTPKVSKEVETTRRRVIEEGAAEEPALTVPILTGGFDATDAAMRLVGQDPYVSRKLKFLDSTRDERAEIASVNKQADLADAARTTRVRLRRIYRRRDLTWPQKRAIYFELWDECSETGSEGERDATASVRATIIGFINKKLPATNVHAFTKNELGKLNRKRESTATFRPYR